MRWGRGRKKFHARARRPRDTPEQVQEGYALCGHHPLNIAGYSLPSHERAHSGIRYTTAPSRWRYWPTSYASPDAVAGDFNAISPEDDGLVEKNELVDAWVALHGRAAFDGATWGVGVERRDGLGPGRLDRVAMTGLKAKEMEVLRPGPIEVPRPGEKPVEIPWSDHCGLRCTFTTAPTGPGKQMGE